MAQRYLLRRVRAAALTVMIVLPMIVVVSPAQAIPTPPLRAQASSWLDAVNLYRQRSGLAPVTENTAWSAGIRNHLTYLEQAYPYVDHQSGPYASAHTEDPASSYYTSDGAAAGRSSDLTFYSSSDLDALAVWMKAPLHAIGLLRPGLQQVGFARDPVSGYAGLDVIRGLATPSDPDTCAIPRPRRSDPPDVLRR